MVSGQDIILQLHSFEVDNHHGPVGDRNDRPYGNGLLLWFEIDDFDATVTRATAMNMETILPPHRNPQGGDGGTDHREIWLRDPDGNAVVLARHDGEASRCNLPNYPLL